MRETIHALFNPKTIKKLCSGITITSAQRKAANEWLGLLESGQLEKEKQNYFKFALIILKDLLGYPVKDDMGYEEGNVEFTFANKEGKKVVCFEAKGTETKDLFAPQYREKKEHSTPVKQTWDYMGNLNLDYGVTTNYQDFVLIDKNRGTSKYHFFDFTEIKNNDDKLREFIAIFCRDSIIEKRFVESLYSASVIEEREFTKEFYKLFHETRLMLITEFQTNGVSNEEAIHYAQLFLNRLIFIFFAEDTDKLQRRIFADRMLKVLEAMPVTEHSKYASETIVNFFESLDKGAEIPIHIFGFNGGLFQDKIPSTVYFKDLREANFFKDVYQHSELKKEIKLDELAESVVKAYRGKLNPIISNLLAMDSFDFSTDLNVNILGHIFEQSLADLEGLKEGQVSKRKKEGIFYTPEFITDYICRNTIVSYLSKNGVTNVGELVSEYSDNIEELEKRFKEIKILDPACGSGAFLLKAVDVLLEIHKQIQMIKESKGKYSTGNQFQLTKWSEESEARAIIENNIFGVDINEESVEITKLSLFLKIATGDRKLIDLSKNIKVGNSLIDDKSLISAFSWENEFTEVMKSGKFDVIIGNPPYVTTRKIPKVDRDHLWIKYKSFLKDEMNTFTLFYARINDLIKEKGFWGYISPSGWYTNNPYVKLREWFFRENKILEIVDFPYRFFPFDDVNTETAIVLGQKMYEQNNEIRILKGERDILKTTNQITSNLRVSNVKQDEVLTNPNCKLYIYQTKITSKLDKITPKLGEFIEVHNPSSLDRKYRYPRTTKQYDKCVFSEKEIAEDIRLKNISAPCLEGDDIQRYFCIDRKKFTNFKWTDKNGDEQELNKKTMSWMKQIKIVGQRITGQVSRRLIFSMDFTEKITMPSANIILLKTPSKNESENKDMLFYILGLLNSKLFNYYYENKYGEANTNITSDVIEELPIIFSDKQKIIIRKVSQIIDSYQEFNEKTKKIFDRMKDNLGLETISMKLERFYELSYNEFLSELGKNNIKLSLKQQDEWQDYFETYKKELSDLKSVLDKTDDELDRLVYEIYGLTDNEIKIVEESS